MELYSKTIVGGGTAVMYNANQVFIITRTQEKDIKTNEIIGYNFTINIEKSRFVREKSKFPLLVTYDEGIFKWSGLFENALEAGFITSEKKGWYEIKGSTKGVRAADLEADDAYWTALIKDPDFNQFIKNKYSLSQGD